MVFEEFSELVKTISESEELYQKTPIYNFGKRSSIRKIIAENKEQFTSKVSAFLSTLLAKTENNVTELKGYLASIETQISQIDYEIDEIEKTIRKQKSLISALNNCNTAFTANESADILSGISQATHKLCFHIISAYIEQWNAFNRLSTRLSSLVSSQAELQKEIDNLNENRYSAEVIQYITSCNKVVKRLQFNEIMRSVMLKDLLGTYKSHNQKYQKTKKRNKK